MQVMVSRKAMITAPPPMILVLLLLVACTGAPHETTERFVATNAQIDMVESPDLEHEIRDLATSAGGTMTVSERSYELRIPVANWIEVFSALQCHPASAGGEQVWGQDITDQVLRLRRELASASGPEAADIEERLAYRADRVARVVIVVRIRSDM